MATRSEKSRHRQAASSALETARRLAPRRATADRRLRILERLTARLSGAMLRAPRGRATDSADHRRDAGEPPPAGFVQWQIARIREAMIVARRMMGELQATDRFIRMTSELDRRHDFAQPLAGGRRGSRAARRFGAHPAPPASDQAPVEAGGETFPACKPLKSLKTELESTHRSVRSAPSRHTRDPFRRTPARPRRAMRVSDAGRSGRGTFSCLQTLEKPRNGIGMSPSSFDPRPRDGRAIGFAAHPRRLLAGRCAIAAREKLTAGRSSPFAGKWRRNELKTLNPRREMVWPRKPRSHNI